MYFRFRKSHIMLLHQQLKYDRVLVFILREVIYRFHLFNIWSKFAVITQAENCFGVSSAVALFEINHWCGASRLNTLTLMSKREDSRWTLAVLICKTFRCCWCSQGGFLIGFKEIQEELKLLLRWRINFLELCLCKLWLILLWTWAMGSGTELSIVNVTSQGRSCIAKSLCPVAWQRYQLNWGTDDSQPFELVGSGLTSKLWSSNLSLNRT